MSTRESRPQRLDILLQKESPEDTSEYLLSQPVKIKNIAQHAFALFKLNTVVKELLSPVLQPWCRVAHYRQNILVLEVANASWMTRLRYEQPHLLSALRKQILPSLGSISIRINPDLILDADNIKHQFEVIPKKSDSGLQLSAKTAEALIALSRKGSKKLGIALRRLAGSARRSTKK